LEEDTNFVILRLHPSQKVHKIVLFGYNRYDVTRSGCFKKIFFLKNCIGQNKHVLYVVYLHGPITQQKTKQNRWELSKIELL